MKKITLTNLFVAILSFTATSLIAQDPNATGLPGNDLIYAEDGLYSAGRGFDAFPTLDDYGGNTLDQTTTVACNLPTTRPQGGANLDFGAVRTIQGNQGSDNLATDTWIVYDTQDLSLYDGGSKYLTLITRFQYHSNAVGGQQKDNTVTILYRNSDQDADPTDETPGNGGPWMTVPDALITAATHPDTSVTSDGWARRNVSGEVGTNTIDFSSITAGTNFAVAIHRVTLATGPNSEETVLDPATNRNGLFSVGGSLWTGTLATASVSKNNLNANISVYPNPTNSLVNISVANGTEIAQVKLSNLTGATVYANTSSKAIDVSSLAKGIYILQITTTDGTTTSSKVVVN